MTSTNDIRRSFLDYFGSNEHAEVASAPLVPFSDPTLPSFQTKPFTSDNINL